MAEPEKIIQYFKSSEPFKELFLNSYAINKRFGGVLKESDSVWTVKFIHQLGIDIYQNIIDRELNKETGIHQFFTEIDVCFKDSFKSSTDPLSNCIVEYWSVLTDIVGKNEYMHPDKTVSVTIDEIKRILNHSLLIRFYLDKFSEKQG